MTDTTTPTPAPSPPIPKAWLVSAIGLFGVAGSQLSHLHYAWAPTAAHAAVGLAFTAGTLLHAWYGA